ncbi:MAG TPA: hypothetical protein VF712_17375 [Thermoleophilaceae bacterium]|jgi:hypothetical protein
MTNARNAAVAWAATAALTLALAGCSEDPESAPLAPERAPEGGIASDGLSQKDARMARDVAVYFQRNTDGTPLAGKIERVSVRKGVITVETSLALSGKATGSARDVCGLIQGSDAADFTPGHTVTGNGPRVTCPHRTS